MAYQRKTQDEYRLHINYGYGWEHEVSEAKWADIKQRKAEYRANCPEYPVKITGPHRQRSEAS